MTTVVDNTADAGSDASSNARPYTIESLHRTKRKGPHVANVAVRFGAVVVRMRLMNGTNGLWLAPPSRECRGPGGRVFHKAAAMVDADVRDRLNDDAIALYRETLKQQHRNEPPPLIRDAEPNRVKELLERSAEHVDANTPNIVYEGVCGILNDPKSSPRQRVAAAKVLAKLLKIASDNLARVAKATARKSA